MGDLEQDIGALLGEDSPPEAEDESRGTEKSAETTESGESGSQDQDAGSEEETSETRSEGEQPESEGSQEEVESSEEESESEEDSRDAQIRELQAEVNRLSKGEATKSAEAESETSTSQEESKSDPFDPFMGQDFDSIIESKESFQKWAEGLYERAKKDTHEEILKRLPETVNSYVEHQVAIRDSVNEFYRQNDDLVNYKNYVGQIANEVQGEHSDWTFDQILEETATRVRQKLGLKEKAQGKGSSSQRKPALSGGTKTGSSKARSGNSGEELSEVEKHIQSLLPENE